MTLEAVAKYLPSVVRLGTAAYDAWRKLRDRVSRKTERRDPPPFPDLPPRSNATIYEPDGTRRKL